MEKFYPLTAIMTDKLRKAKLTEAQWRLWSYLVTIAPFGDKYYQLPDTLEIISVVEISKSTFYRAIAKFQQEGIFDFQDQGFKFRNLDNQNLRSERVSSRKSKVSSVSIPVSPMNISVSPMRLDSYPCENQPPEPLPDNDSGSSQTIQTIHTLSYSSDAHPPTLGEKEGEEEENAKEKNTRADVQGNGKVICEKPKSINSFVTNNKNPEVERSSAADFELEKNNASARMEGRLKRKESYDPSSDKRVQAEEKELPDGEWKDERGHLKAGFMEFAMATYKQMFPEKQNFAKSVVWVLVTRYFRNDFTRLEDFWFAYLSDSAYRVDNAASRYEHGLSLQSEEKQSLGQRLVETVGTETDNLPSSLPNREMTEQMTNYEPRPSRNRFRLECGAHSALSSPTDLPSLTAKEQRTVTLPHDEKFGTADNPQAYQQWQPSQPEIVRREPKDGAEEETINVWKELSAFLKGGVKSMPERHPVPEVDKLKELNEWMQDPILREDAIARVKESDRYTFEYDDDGSPLSVIEPEF